MIDLSRTGPVFVLAMQSGENRFNRPFLNALNGALDEIEASSGPAGLVTVGTDKFYSNGLDLDWLMSSSGEGPSFIGDFLAFFARMMSLPLPTVAALNGHAFAGGGMFALTHDFRVMRADRGYFCLPEVDLGMPFAPGMNALITGKLDSRTASDLILTGRRVGGGSLQLRVVDDRRCRRKASAGDCPRRALSGRSRDVRAAHDCFAEAIELLASRKMP
jgi:enoyl-CoA hydratase/carnithine racemase